MQPTCLYKDDLAQMDTTYFESLTHAELVTVASRLLETSVTLWERVHQNSTNSSQPPSSDTPYRPVPDAPPESQSPEETEETSLSKTEQPSPVRPDGEPDSSSGSSSATPRRSRGKQPGAPGMWRADPLIAEEEVPHEPAACSACAAPFSEDTPRKAHMGYYVLELERSETGVRVVCRLHRYYSSVCTGCGHETKARPGEGIVSVVEGRKKDLRLQEYVLVGPMFATFIASLSVRYRMSRPKIREFLQEWLQTTLGTGTIDRCIREAGIACEPVVEELVEALQEAEVLHLDETSWYEHGRMRWLWVVISVTSQIAVYRVGSRKKTVVLELVTDVFVGWLVSDGYMAYRSYEKRQRCVAHLIRKAVALAEGVDAEAAQLGDWLLSELRGLIHTMAEGGDAAKRRCFPILARLKRACLIGRDGPTPKLQALAKEILNDWEAVVAFVKHPDAALPPTNNEAERALRHAVISRRISHGTRTSEGSRAYSALLSVIETCRLRKRVPWDYIAEVIALARRGIAPPPIPNGI
jgi:transposase